MFEVVKLFLEVVLKSISPRAIRNARKKRRVNEIGTELFLFYTHVNDCLMGGRQIVNELRSCLRQMIDAPSRGPYYRDIPTDVGVLLGKQRATLLKLLSSLSRLHYELQVVSPEAYVKLKPLVEGKMCALILLTGVFDVGQPPLASFDSAELEQALDPIEGESERDHVRRVAGLLINAGLPDVDLHGTSLIPITKHDQIQTYLDSRQPDRVLDEIEAIAARLREAIMENFSLKEILVRAGDIRAGH